MFDENSKSICETRRQYANEIFVTNMQILSEVVIYEGMNIKKGNIWVVGGL